MILKIVIYPNDILTTPTEPLTQAEILSSEIQTLIENMIDTCLNADGLGLAANQVGVGKSLFVYRKPGSKQFDIMINPRVKKQKDMMHSKGEGCLSLPDQYFNIHRYKRMIIDFIDQQGKEMVMIVKTKRTAKILQHEIDHLDGQLINRGKKV